jgi:SAM-dependent methyltransferase
MKNVLRKQAKKFDYKGRVVDLGCGDSPYRDIILLTAEDYVGVDHPNSKYKNGFGHVAADLANRLPFEDETFDTVVSFQVLDDLREPLFFLQECFRILKSGGCLFMTTPFMWKIHEAPHDYYRFTKYGLEYLLQKSKFERVSVEEIYAGFWGMWLLKLNYYTLRFVNRYNKYLLYLFWWTTQVLAMVLDRLDKNGAKDEAMGYVVRACKP